MRSFVFGLAMLWIGSFASAAPPLKPVPSPTAIKKALAEAGPPASNADVAAAYPGFRIAPKHTPAPWFVASTDDGCLFYAIETGWAPGRSGPYPYKPPSKLVAEWMHDHFLIKWTGTPCTPGKFISGQGTLLVGDANTRHTVGARRDDDYKSETGTMQDGVFNGRVRYLYSWDEEQTQLIAAPQEYELFGGCSDSDPGTVSEDITICQPRVPNKSLAERAPSALGAKGGGKASPSSSFDYEAALPPSLSGNQSQAARAAPGAAQEQSPPAVNQNPLEDEDWTAYQPKPIPEPSTIPAGPTQKFLDPKTGMPCIREIKRETTSGGGYTYVTFHNSCDKTISVGYKSATAGRHTTGAYPFGDTHATLKTSDMPGFVWWVE